MSEDRAIHTLYERIGHLLYFQPYGELGRYLTYYAEDRLYLVFDLWYHGFFLVEAKSPTDAINKVNCDQLAYLPKIEEDELQTNADKFRKVFGIYATELWAMPEAKFLEWLNAKRSE